MESPKSPIPSSSFPSILMRAPDISGLMLTTNSSPFNSPLTLMGKLGKP